MDLQEQEIGGLPDRDRREGFGLGHLEGREDDDFVALGAKRGDTEQQGEEEEAFHR